jgi:ammonium transporter Rh
MTDGNFAAATVLISYGCILGKSTPLQLVVLTILESIFFQINRNIFSFEHFLVEDAGGTIVIHVFGAYFGLAVAKVLGPPKDQANLNSTSGISDILSLVGTIFLWLFWPSFNGGAFTADPVHCGRAIANTVVALLGSCTCTFLISGIIGGKLTPADIQNATLAGGVAIGAVARMDVGLGWASIIGSVGGTISTLGYQYIQPFLERKIGLYDTCGVNNLHGLPGIFGSIISCIFCVTSFDAAYLAHTKDTIGLYQLASLASTLGMALVCGTFTGYICKFCKEMIKKINTPKNPTQSDLDNSVHFNDFSYWKAADDASQHGGTAAVAESTTAPMTA